LAHHPSKQAERDDQHERRRPVFKSADGVHAAQDDENVDRPEDGEAQPERPVLSGDHRGVCPAAAKQLPTKGKKRPAADPGLDPKPSAGNPGPQQRGDVGAKDTKRCPGENRIGDAVFGAGVAVRQHWNQDDDVGERDRQDRLIPGHTQRDEPGCQQVGRDVVRHPDPQSHVVVGIPGPFLDRHRGQVVVIKRTVADR
jgi:hypothetical protein